MITKNIRDEYFEWMYDLVWKGDKHSKHTSFRKLMSCLYETRFRWSIRMDENRAVDGTGLRYRFIRVHGYDDDLIEYLDGPCSVLEMMVALAVRCEESIMDDPLYGDRTGHWFRKMIVNLGLGSMTDIQFDRHFVEDTINRFLDREYAPNGQGGLFTVKNPPRDMRDVEIWYQMCWYLDDII